MVCLNQECKYTMKDQLCSKKENGLFYFMCPNCLVIHKVEINSNTFELDITLAEDSEIDNIKRLMDGLAFSDNEDIGEYELSFKVFDK